MKRKHNDKNSQYTPSPTNRKVGCTWFVKSPERKSPRTEPKTNIKICNSNKEEFKEQVTAEGKEMNVKIVTMDVKNWKKCRIFSVKQDRKTSS